MNALAGNPWSHPRDNLNRGINNIVEPRARWLSPRNPLFEVNVFAGLGDVSLIQS